MDARRSMRVRDSLWSPPLRTLRRSGDLPLFAVNLSMQPRMIQRCCTLRALRLLRRSFEITSPRCSHDRVIGEDQIATHKRVLNSSRDAHPLEGGISLR